MSRYLSFVFSQRAVKSSDQQEHETRFNGLQQGVTTGHAATLSHDPSISEDTTPGSFHYLEIHINPNQYQYLSSLYPNLLMI